MNPKNKFRLLFFSMMIGLLFLISACGNEESSSKTEKKGGTESSAVTLDSTMGKVTIPANAKKIIAPFHEDALLALGVTPVAKWAIGKTVQDYLETDLKDIPSIEWNVPLEQVLNHEPDLIILESNMEGYDGTYEDYNKIAPTYVMTEETTGDWRKQIETFGKLLGKEKEANKVLSDYNAKVADASAQLKKAIGDETVAVIWTIGNQFFLFEHNRHSAEVLYSELGVNQPALVKGLGEAASTQWNPISIEKLSELDADHVFLLAAEGEQGIETLNNSSVWKSTPAVENGNVYIVKDPSNWTNRGLIASQKTIDDILGALVQ
jgi:iron complex transport system substrate-binding protein